MYVYISIYIYRCLTRVDCQTIVDPSLLPGVPSSSVRVKLGSSFDTFRRRWTICLYRKPCYETNNEEPRFSRTELEVDSETFMGVSRLCPGRFMKFFPPSTPKPYHSP